MSQLNSLRGLALGASALALGLAVLTAPASAQTVVVVGTPEGSAPGAVGGTALTGTTALGSDGQLIFNHDDDSEDGYVLVGPDVSVTGGTTARIDLLAGTTTFTALAPYRGPDNAWGQTVVNPASPTTSFQGLTTVHSGATLQLAQWFGLRALAENGKFVARTGNTFQYDSIAGEGLEIQQGGRLTGQGRISPSWSNTGDAVVIAGTVSPHGFPERGGEYDSAFGRMDFGDQNTPGTLVFTQTSVLEMDVDMAIANDGTRMDADLIRTNMNTRIEDGAQIRVRLAESDGTTTYLPGRTVLLLEMPIGLKAEAHKHVYDIDWSTVDLDGIDWNNMPSWLNSQYVEIGSVPAPEAGDTLVIDGHTYLYSNDINQATRGVTGMFTLAPDSDTQLTHYLGLELRKGKSSVKQYGETVDVESSVYLEVVQNRQFTEDAQSANGAAAAEALQAIGVYNPMFVRLLNLQDDAAAITNGELPAFLDSLSGELYVGVRGLLTQDAWQNQRSLSRRLSNYKPGGAHLWAEALGTSRKLESDNIATLKEESYGFLAGIDATVLGPWRLGVSGGYRQANISSSGARTGKADIKRQTYLTAYTTGAWGNFRAHAGGGLSNARIETRRSVFLTDVVADDLSASYDSTVLNAFGELSYNIPLRGLEVEPFVGGTFIRTETDLVREAGKVADSGAPLTIVGDENKVQYTTLGVRARTLSVGALAFDGMLGWQHGFGDLELTGQHMLNNRQLIPVRGADLSENAAVVEIGARWQVTEKVTLDAVYDGLIGNEGNDHTARIGVSMRF